MKKHTESLNEIKQRGYANHTSYYNRIHDKLFYYNNMLIAGYFVLIALPHSNSSPWLILLPLFNMLHLIQIDYKRMLSSKFEIEIDKKQPSEVIKYNHKLHNTALRSLITVTLTIIVTIIFVVQLFYI